MLPSYGHVMQCEEIPLEFPMQHQPGTPGQPGFESLMNPRPVSEFPDRTPSGRMRGKVALITGGDSGIGRAVAYLFAAEGADVAIVYLNEHADAAETQERVRRLGRRCLAIPGDIGDDVFCRQAVRLTVSEFGRLDVLVNNAGTQYFTTDIMQISAGQIERVFRTNVFSQLYLAQAAVPYMRPGSSIINTSSIAAYEGYPGFVDYTASKGAVSALTRGLAASLIGRGIRVNEVSPGRTWTPLVAFTFPPEIYSVYGHVTPMKRAAQPAEIAPAYLYLASSESAYVVGQTIHVNGGEYLGG